MALKVAQDAKRERESRPTDTTEVANALDAVHEETSESHDSEGFHHTNEANDDLLDGSQQSNEHHVDSSDDITSTAFQHSISHNLVQGRP